MCVPNYNSKCWVWGDPHYQSFDGLNANFHGTCSYLLAGSVCPGVSAEGLTPFTVITKHESQGNPAVSSVKKVTVTAYNTSIAVHKKGNGRVQVRSVGRSLKYPKEAGVGIPTNSKVDLKQILMPSLVPKSWC